MRRNLSSIGMRQRVFSILLIAFLAGTYSVPAFGWGQKGHRIIAKIAYESQGYSYTEYAEKLELEYGWAKKYIAGIRLAKLLNEIYK